MWEILILLGIGLFTYTICEQINYHLFKGPLPGPLFVVPVIGSIGQMIRNPYQFWRSQASYGPLSCNSIAGRFMVLSTDTETSRKIFMDNTKLKLALHPNAERILGENNIAFLQGDYHKQLRSRLLPLFTKRALSVYLSIQEKLIRKHLANWMKLTEESFEWLNFRTLARDLNIETSQEVFVGTYLTEQEKLEFSKNYALMNAGFLSMPLYLPGTSLWKAVKAKQEIVAVLAKAAARSKARMILKEEPKCLLDFWVEIVLKECENGSTANYTKDDEIGHLLLDFLFASQDASTSSLVWIVALLADPYKMIRKEVRDEQMKLRPNDEQITYELLSQMQYTKQVVKETLRFRAPATLVPMITLKEFVVTDTYTVPKNSFLIPDIWSGCQQGYTDPHLFNPDRFNANSDEERLCSKNFLTFGCGSHQCLGKEYAVNHLMLFLAILARNSFWVRQRTDKSDDIDYLPTISPADGVLVGFYEMNKDN